MIRIPSSGQFLEEVERRRPQGAPRASTKALAGAAREFAVLAAPLIEDLFAVDEEVEDFEMLMSANAKLAQGVCIDLALMAEDLLSGGFLWRIIEDYNARLFGSPLPLVIPFAGTAGAAEAAGGESGSAKFPLGGRREAPPNSLNLPSGNLALPGGAAPALDERRFQFFLFTVWPYYAPGVHVLADDGALMELASLAARFFKRLRGGAVSPGAFLSEPDCAHDAIDGSGVKRKLVWLGGSSYLFSAAFWDYFIENGGMKRGEAESTMDDFLCQECTQWSGLGALDVLAEALRLEGQDRADLLGWSERHVAMYDVKSVAEFAHPGAPGVPAVLLVAVNIINGQRYEVPMFQMTARECPFKAGMRVFGMLARWRGVWRWSGAQKTFNPADKFDAAKFRRDFILGSPQLAYRLCPDLLANARESEARMREHFLRFHGDELVVQPDGLALAAGEQRRMREYTEARAAELGMDLEQRKKALDNETGEPGMSLPEDMVRSTRPVALFYVAGEGVNMMRYFDAVRSGLRKVAFEEMSDEERDLVSDFVESASITPEFVRRVARDEGCDGIVAFYCGDARGFDAAAKERAVEYLLRRHKGADFRTRYPNVSVVPED